MQSEEVIVKIIFNNQMAFCCIFGALGGVAHVLDVNTKLSPLAILSKILVSAIAGLLLFFATYEIERVTPSMRITASIITGFYGSFLFRYLAKIYFKQVIVETVKESDSETEVVDQSEKNK